MVGGVRWSRGRLTALRASADGLPTARSVLRRRRLLEGVRPRGPRRRRRGLEAPAPLPVRVPPGRVAGLAGTPAVHRRVARRWRLSRRPRLAPVPGLLEPGGDASGP